MQVTEMLNVEVTVDNPEEYKYRKKNCYNWFMLIKLFWKMKIWNIL